MSLGLLGKKIGMTTVYSADGKAVGATVIDVSGNQIVQTKTEASKDGYAAAQVGFGKQKESRVSKAQVGHFKKWETETKQFVREFRVKDSSSLPPAGTKLEASLFSVGQWVDVTGTSKGKGFQGAMKRHGFAGQPATHGHMMHRRTGSIGCRLTPGLVWKNQKMPGHDGNVQRTTQNLKIVAVRTEDQVILVSGAIPGSKGSLIRIKPAKKK